MSEDGHERVAVIYRRIAFDCKNFLNAPARMVTFNVNQEVIESAMLALMAL